MQHLIQRLIEKQAYGVCSRIGEIIGVPSARIRIWFIYTTCFTLGSPLVIYVLLAIWMDMGRHCRKPSIWELD